MNNLIKLISKLVIVFLFIILVPLILISSLLVLIIDRSYPIYSQERSGINGASIKIYKITSMKKKKSSNDKYVTILGKILRLSKIDELPQLYNILKGDMSFIGPRPLYLEFNEFIKDDHKSRLDIKPGLTGLAQVKVLDSTDWTTKFDYDVYYVKNKSIKLDTIILLLTLKNILQSLINRKKRSTESLDYMDNFFKNYVNK